MIYVDKAIWPWRGKKWCHLFADTIEELHEFALGLGLKREWFQNREGFPHYDLTENKRQQALKNGAIKATKEIIRTYFKRGKNEIY